MLSENSDKDRKHTFSFGSTATTMAPFKSTAQNVRFHCLRVCCFYLYIYFFHAYGLSPRQVGDSGVRQLTLKNH